jgi:hypothetical protein
VRLPLRQWKITAFAPRSISSLSSRDSGT